MGKVNIIEIPDNHPLWDKVDSDAIKIIKRLRKFGYTAYLVGGCVRDLLLGKTPKDFDVVTNAWPRRIRSLFQNSKIIGRRFQLVHVYFAEKVIEVSTFRQEDKTPPEITKDGSIRKSENRYGTEQTDAFRRDLTINALFFDPIKKRIIDYVDGYKDLNEKRIKVIGNPLLRFEEDPVRIIRALRHAFRTGFEIQKDVIEVIRMRKSNLKLVSAQRNFDEIKKDALHGDFKNYLQYLHVYSVLTTLFPNINPETIDWDLIERIERGNINLYPEVMVASLFFAFSKCEISKIPSAELVQNSLFDLFSICSPPKNVLKRTVLLLMLLKRFVKQVQGKRVKKNFTIPDSVLPIFNNLLAVLAPEMIQFVEVLQNESIRDYSSKIR